MLTAVISNDMHSANAALTYIKKRMRSRRLILLLFVWVTIAALRGVTGLDAYNYWVGYKEIYNESISFQESLSMGRDILYRAFITLVSKFSDGNWVVGCAAIALLAYGPILYIIYKYSKDVSMSCLLFIFMFGYFYSFNGIREGISFAFASLAYYSCLREKKYVGYVLIMLIAFGFHAGALLIVPFHIMSMLHYESLTSQFFLLSFFVGAFVIFRFWDVFMTVLGAVGLNSFVESYSDLRAGEGSGLIRALVALAPALLGFMYRRNIVKAYKDSDRDFMLVICYGITMIYSMQNYYLSQVTPYFLVPNLIYIPKLVNSLEDDRRMELKTIMLLLYFAYMIFSLLHGDQGVYPYVPVWESNTF